MIVMRVLVLLISWVLCIKMLLFHIIQTNFIFIGELLLLLVRLVSWLTVVAVLSLFTMLLLKEVLPLERLKKCMSLYKSEHVRTAHQVSPEWHVKVLAQWQKWLDGGCSKTVNMPNNASVDDIKEVYINAWKSGCKGITVYRDGCREQQVLYSKPCTPVMGKCVR